MIDTTALEQRLADLEARLARLEAENVALRASTASPERRSPFTPTHPTSKVLRAVSEVSGVSVDAILARERPKFGPLRSARRAAAVLMRADGYSLSAIGMALNRHHTTIIDHLRKPAPAELVAGAERLLGGG